MKYITERNNATRRDCLEEIQRDKKGIETKHIHNLSPFEVHLI